MIQETQAPELSKPISKPAALAKRVEYIDIAKGIGIGLVVMGHNDFALIPPFAHKLIYSFHMPMFFFSVRHVFQTRYAHRFISSSTFQPRP